MISLSSVRAQVDIHGDSTCKSRQISQTCEGTLPEVSCVCQAGCEECEITGSASPQNPGISKHIVVNVFQKEENY